MKVTRDTARHEIDDLNVTSQLRGDFAAAHLDGRQRARRGHRHAEEHDLRVRARRHRIARGVPAAPRRSLHELVRLGLGRPVGGRAATRGSGSASTGASHDHAFVRSGQEVRTAVVVADGDDPPRARRTARPHGAEDHRVGVRGLPEGPLHDAARDLRPHPRDGCRDAVAVLRGASRSTTTPSYDDVQRPAAEAFAERYSAGAADDPVRHGQPRARAHTPRSPRSASRCRTSTTSSSTSSPFGLDNPNEVFFAADRPYGLIEAQVTRDGMAPVDLAWEGATPFC